MFSFLDEQETRDNSSINSRDKVYINCKLLFSTLMDQTSTCLSSSSLEPTLVITVSVEGADGQLSKGVFLRMSLIDTNTPSWTSLRISNSMVSGISKLMAHLLDGLVKISYHFILNFLGDCDFKFIKINVSYFTVVEKYIGHNFYKIGAFHFHPFPQAILIPFN